jgi:site-specific DNA-methyltransferase (cytosine-N4-specific)
LFCGKGDIVVSNFSQLFNTYADRKNAESFTHGFHPYFASFHPQIPKTFIERFTSKGDVVLDPFCGSGTTLVEAKITGRHSIGIDVNPLACLLSKVKTTPIEKEKLSQCFGLLSRIKCNLNFLYGQSTLVQSEKFLLEPEIPDFRNREYWFEPHVLKELGIIKAHIQRLQDKDLKDFCLVAFSSIIVKVSNQQHETRYKKIDKKLKAFEAYENFSVKLRQMIQRMTLFNKVASNASCKIFCEDLRFSTAIKDEEADLIVTSPPYLNAWDYNLYQRFRFYWLGFDHLKFRNTEIGAHLKHSYINDSVSKYSEDMTLCLKQMHRMLKTGATCCIVIGEAFVQGKRVELGEILTKVATDLGFTLEKKIKKEIFGPHFSQRRSAGNKLESIIILRKS